jgi:hypothetical protein
VRAGLAVRAELAARSIESAALELLERPQGAAESLFDRPRVRNRMEDVLNVLTAML